MKKTIIYLLVTITFLAAAKVQASKYAASFLDLGVGARALGMGSAYVALSNDATGFYWNPAGLAFLAKFEAASMYANLFKSLENQSYIGAAMPIFGGATVSAAWIRLSIDDIPRYQNPEDYRANYPLLENVPAEGSFSCHDDAFFISFAKYIKWNLDLGWQYFEIPIDVGFGLNFKYIGQSLDDKYGSGLGIDTGAIIRIGLNEIFQESYFGDLAFGINLQDIASTRITWNTKSKHKDDIDYNIKYGLSYIQPLSFIDSYLTFAFDMDSKYDGSSHLGSELLFKSMLALRIGTNGGNFTTGAGIYIWKFKFDYAYQSHGLGNSHRVSLLFGL